MRKICEMLKKKDVGAIGIGAMIVFIAMVLVAGIAASVLIQTSTRLESQAMATGQETIAEVSTGLAVTDIQGYAPTTENIQKLAITVKPRSGSKDIDLDEVFVELSDTDRKIVTTYTQATGNNWDDSAGLDDVFGANCFPGSDTNKDDFGILVIEDADSSCSAGNPVINRGDRVMLCLYTRYLFNFSGSNGTAERITHWGLVVPEQGSPGVIAFTTPASFTDNVMDLQ